MQPKDIIRQLYATYEKGDIDAVLDQCHDDVSFIFTADPEFTRYAGAAVGKHGFKERAVSLHNDFEYRDFKILEMIGEGDRVAARTELHMTRRATGREFVMQIADFWRLRDGKAVELIEYYDTALAAQIL